MYPRISDWSLWGRASFSPPTQHSYVEKQEPLTSPQTWLLLLPSSPLSGNGTYHFDHGYTHRLEVWWLSKQVKCILHIFDIKEQHWVAVHEALQDLEEHFHDLQRKHKTLASHSAQNEQHQWPGSHDLVSVHGSCWRGWPVNVQEWKASTQPEYHNTSRQVYCSPDASVPVWTQKWHRYVPWWKLFIQQYWNKGLSLDKTSFMTPLWRSLPGEPCTMCRNVVPNTQSLLLHERK